MEPVKELKDTVLEYAEALIELSGGKADSVCICISTKKDITTSKFCFKYGNLVISADKTYLINPEVQIKDLEDIKSKGRHLVENIRRIHTTHNLNLSPELQISFSPNKQNGLSVSSES